jgi:hypothetical protein
VRTTEWLNYLLRYPGRNITGWQVLRDGAVRGVALLSLVSGGGWRTGRVVDCLLDSMDRELWPAALYALTGQLADQGADLAVCYGSTPWMKESLRRTGYVARRSTPLTVRDPRGLLPAGASFYLTHLEADHAYL